MMERRDWRGLTAGLGPDSYTRLLHPEMERLNTQ
jgi:hypothetical protein